jgi:hypothetical protein
MFCREQAVQLHRESAAIRAKGAELAFVGNGNRRWAAVFKQDYGISSPIYVDTRRESYQALGMRRSLIGYLKPRAALNAVRALRAGFRQGATKGDALQNGGVLVVRPGGLIAFRYLSAVAGDHPDVADVIGSLD